MYEYKHWKVNAKEMQIEKKKKNQKTTLIRSGNLSGRN